MGPQSLMLKEQSTNDTNKENTETVIINTIADEELHLEKYETLEDRRTQVKCVITEDLSASVKAAKVRTNKSIF